MHAEKKHYDKSVAWGYSLPHFTSVPISTINSTFLGVLYITSYNYSPEDFGRLYSLYLRALSFTQFILAVCMQIYQIVYLKNTKRVCNAVKHFEKASKDFRSSSEKFKKALETLSSHFVALDSSFEIKLTSSDKEGGADGKCVLTITTSKGNPPQSTGGGNTVEISCDCPDGTPSASTAGTKKSLSLCNLTASQTTDPGGGGTTITLNCLKDITTKIALISCNIEAATSTITLQAGAEGTQKNLDELKKAACCLAGLLNGLKKGSYKLLETTTKVKATASHLVFGDFNRFRKFLCSTLKCNSEKMKIETEALHNKAESFDTTMTAEDFQEAARRVKAITVLLAVLANNFYEASMRTCSEEFQRESKEFKEACEKFQEAGERFYCEALHVHRNEFDSVKSKFKQAFQKLKDPGEKFNKAIEKVIEEPPEIILEDAKHAVGQCEKAIKSLEMASSKAYDTIDEVASAEAICGVATITADKVCEKLKEVCKDLCDKLGKLCKCIKASLDSACKQICGKIKEFCSNIQTCVNGLSTEVCGKLDELCKCTKNCLQSACTTICGNISTGASKIGECLKSVCEGICKSNNALSTLFETIGKQFKCNENINGDGSGAGSGSTTCQDCTNITVSANGGTSCTISDGNCATCQTAGSTGTCSQSQRGTSTCSSGTGETEECSECTKGIESSTTHQSGCPGADNHSTGNNCTVCNGITGAEVKSTVEGSTKNYAKTVLVSSCQYSSVALNSLINSCKEVSEVNKKIETIKTELTNIGTQLDDISQKFEEGFKAIYNNGNAADSAQSSNDDESTSEFELNLCKGVYFVAILIHAATLFFTMLLPRLSQLNLFNFRAFKHVFRRGSRHSSSGFNNAGNLRFNLIHKPNTPQPGPSTVIPDEGEDIHITHTKPTTLIYLMFFLNGMGYGTYEFCNNILPTFLTKHSKPYSAINGQIRGFTRLASSITITLLKKGFGTRFGESMIFLMLSAALCIFVVPIAIAFFILTKQIDPNPSDSDETDINVMNIAAFAIMETYIQSVYKLNGPIVQYVSTHILCGDAEFKLYAPTIFLTFCFIGSQVFVKLLISMDRTVASYLCIICLSVMYPLLTVPRDGTIASKFMHYIFVGIYGCFNFAIIINHDLMVTPMLNDMKHIKWRWAIQGGFYVIRNTLLSFIVKFIYKALNCDKHLIGIPDSHKDLKGVRFFLFFIFFTQTIAIFATGMFE